MITLQNATGYSLPRPRMGVDWVLLAENLTVADWAAIAVLLVALVALFLAEVWGS